MIISMKQWLGANERTHVLPTDKWYLDFAISILSLVKASALCKREDNRAQTEAAISLSMYFQDAISQSGGWKVFSELYLKQYGAFLPFYQPAEAYAADEINKEDIAFVLWTLQSRPTLGDSDEYTLLNPHDKDLWALSQAVYSLMDACFEEAPISEKPSSPDWVMSTDLLKIPAVPLSEITPDTKLRKDAERCLTYSQGKPLLYFADYQELRAFFVEVLKWDNHPSALLPDLAQEKEFVIYANAKGMLIAHHVAAYFCEDHNPLYDAGRAATEGYEMFCRPGVCPFDLIKYGMAKGLLPDVQLPFPQGKEILHQHWDFITRYYLCEYYEGD